MDVFAGPAVNWSLGAAYVSSSGLPLNEAMPPAVPAQWLGATSAYQRLCEVDATCRGGSRDRTVAESVRLKLLQSVEVRARRPPPPFASVLLYFIFFPPLLLLWST
jgi:hypothetical protein